MRILAATFMGRLLAPVERQAPFLRTGLYFRLFLVICSQNLALPDSLGILAGVEIQSLPSSQAQISFLNTANHNVLNLVSFYSRQNFGFRIQKLTL